MAIRDCVDFYNQDWKVLKRKHEDIEALMIHKVDLPIHNYELDNEDELADSAASLTSLGSTRNTPGSSSTGSITIEDDNAAPTEDDLPQHILQEYRKGVTDETNTKQRVILQLVKLYSRYCRSKIAKTCFSHFLKSLETPTLATPTRASWHLAQLPARIKLQHPFQKRGIHQITFQLICFNRGVQVMVTMKSLSFALEKMEPFFCSLAAFDVSKKKKVSENFYFDFNDDDGTSSLIQEHLVNDHGI